MPKRQDTEVLNTSSAEPTKTDIFLVGIICACIAGRLMFIGKMPLTAPEAYYWEWSKDLAWGYFDHPPMIAYVIRFFTLLGGDGAFFIRLGALLLSVLTTLVLYLLAKDLFGRRTALVACSIIQIIPFFSAVSVVSVPDTPLSFFWVLTVYFVSSATILNRRWAWYAAGVALGLDLMSKYHAFLLILCVLIYLISSKDMRKWLLRKEPYLALLTAFLVFLPNLLWNVLHHATTFRWLLVGRHGGMEFSIKGFLVFVAGFMALMSPLFALLVIRLIPRIAHRALKEYDDRYLLLLSISLPPIIIFGLLSPFIHVGAHWVAVGYSTLFLAVISQLMERSPSGSIYLLQKFPVVSLAFSLVMVICGHLIAVIAGALPPAIHFSGKTHSVIITEKQRELYGWEELSAELKQAVKTMPDPQHTFFITHGYRFASHLRYLLGAEFSTRTTGYNKKQNQYLIWNDLGSLKGWDALFVDKGFSSRDRDLLLKIFERVGPVEELEITVNQFKVRSFYLIRCYGYRAAYL